MLIHPVAIRAGVLRHVHGIAVDAVQGNHWASTILTLVTQHCGHVMLIA
jgi:hypothetical protein